MKALAGRGIKEAAVLADRVRAPAPGVVVLIYHRVGGHSGLEIDPVSYTHLTLPTN